MVLVVLGPGLEQRRLWDDVCVAALGGVGGLDVRGFDVAGAAALDLRVSSGSPRMGEGGEVAWVVMGGWWGEKGRRTPAE